MRPPKLRLELFTIANIDHNPSSTSAQGSLIGTSISVFQHFENESNEVERLAISWVMVSKYHGQHTMPVLTVHVHLKKTLLQRSTFEKIIILNQYSYN